LAYSGSDKYQSLSAEWGQAISQYQPTWTNFVDLVTDTGSTTQVRFADAPVASLNSWDGSTAITQATYQSSHEQTVTLAGAASRLVLNDIDVRMDSGLVERKASALLEAVQATVETQVYSLLESTFTSTMSNGVGSAVTEICSNSHGYDSNNDGTGDAYQSNALTTALSYDGLNTALEKGHKWKNFAGEPMGLFRGNSTLIVSPKNRAVAAKLCDSANILASGTTSSAVFMGSTNPNQGVKYIVSSHLTADDDDWWLLDNQNTPVKVWMPFAPKLTISSDQNTHGVELCCSIWLKAFVECPPNGIIGANVAG
tara:strand:+ start:316 stop:1251 length:936 start_codon:yes stop_codon:yes gene_type:complete